MQSRGECVVHKRNHGLERTRPLLTSVRFPNDNSHIWLDPCLFIYYHSHRNTAKAQHEHNMVKHNNWRSYLVIVSSIVLFCFILHCLKLSSPWFLNLFTLKDSHYEVFHYDKLFNSLSLLGFFFITRILFPWHFIGSVKHTHIWMDTL